MIITEYFGFNIKKLYEIFSISKNELEEYIDFLINNELAFFTDEPKSFEEIDPVWEIPRTIDNSIIDIDGFSNYDIINAITQIDKLGARAVQIRLFSEFNFLWVKELLENIVLKTKRIKTIELYIKYTKEIDVVNLEKEFSFFHLLSQVIIHSSNKDLVLSDKGTIILFTQEKINNETHCGIVNDYLFAPNLDHVLEARKHNTCLNKKISIDTKGNIKNCPSMEIAYGSIDNILLTDVLKINDFRALWNVSKDQIKVCQDCEFRLICTDCRAYIENRFDKPIKCNYNPYTAIWEN
jgi:SPASM domain peptide maturase of grasp-with-spasm system